MRNLLFGKRKDKVSSPMPEKANYYPDDTRLRSERVYTEVYEFTSIALPKGYTQADYDDAYEELQLFRKDQGYSDSPISMFYDDETQRYVLRFSTGSSIGGTGYNTLIWPNSIDVRTVMDPAKKTF